MWDHILGGPGAAHADRRSGDGAGRLVVRTERIRLTTAVTPQPRRRPQKLAREAVTVDHLSGRPHGAGRGARRPARRRVRAFGEPDDARILAERLDGGLEVAAAGGRGERFQPSRAPLPRRPGDIPAPAVAATAHPGRGRLHLAAPAAAAARRPPGRGGGRPADARRRPGRASPARWPSWPPRSAATVVPTDRSTWPWSTPVPPGEHAAASTAVGATGTG